ncbi:MAG: PSD1 and planctomycete cytochrome C domain-containing protein [Verrucomicrobiota bacterium]
MKCEDLRADEVRIPGAPSRVAAKRLVNFILIFALSLVGHAAGLPSEKLQFNRDIRPILSDKCFLCHGPDKNNRKGKMRLDVREEALAKEAFKPGKPDESELVRRIFTTDPDDHMPPAESHRHLTETEKATLKQWIAEGAEYQPHWAYITPVRPKAPDVKNTKWMKNPIDSFVLKKLETKKISPAPEADKTTLLRRLSLDLVGLPPTREEVAAFVNDRSPKAYEHQVERLLASPHFGERMAVSWLDLARFADTVGYHGDQNINVFPYRDYVINAFNKNKSFDQFTIEQLAGDLLPDATTEQKIASGFNRLNMVTREGGAQPDEYLAKYGADRVRTVSTSFLGSTMGCCECHDHKFDPFSTKDFYSMKAFFADIRQWGVYSDYGYTPNPDLRGFNNDYPFPPEIIAKSPYLEKQLGKVRRRMAELGTNFSNDWKTNAKAKTGFEDWRKQSLALLETNRDGWTVLTPTNVPDASVTNAKPSKLLPDADGSISFIGGAAERELELPLPTGWLAAVRLELLPSEKHDGKILLDKSSTTEINLTAGLKSAGEKEKPLSFYHAEADRKEERYASGFAIIGVESGWKTAKLFQNVAQTAVYLLSEPVKAAAGDQLVIKLGKNSAARIRLSVTPFANFDPLKAGANESLVAELKKTTSKISTELAEVYLASANPQNDAFAKYKKLYAEALECRDGESPTVVSVSWKPMETRVLPRGNWQATNGEVVLPEVPHFLRQVPDADGHRLTRLDFAKWIVAKDNPLTARTFVNRTWKQFFGHAISAVVDDLGAQGEWPTHPELLDWLSVEFMDSGWDIKHIVKLMVMSAAYRESSNPNPKIHEMDPGNLLLASQSPRRLEAEFVRDNALFISGLLNPDIGGPSAFPYQPEGYYANLQFPNREYKADDDQRQYRRGLYTHWQRTFLQPMLANFDAPGREECTASRNVSNSPQQALTLLNDPTFVEAARKLAGRIVTAPNDSQRLDNIYQLALARPAKPQEQTSMEQFLKLQRDYYNANPGDAKKLLQVGLAPETKSASEPELAAWTQVCRVVLGLHETITRY